MRKVELVARESLYEGFFRAERVTLRHELFQGGMGPELCREVMYKRAAAGVLPYDPRTDRLLLIEQFRIGAWAAGHEGWLLEIIAGYVEPGEDVEAMVHREAMEEAGIELDRLEPVTRLFLSPASCNEEFDLFLAQADLQHAGGIHGLVSEGENIRVVVLSFDEAMQAALSGKIANAPALLALQALQLRRLGGVSR